jgi:hypothetical protein
MTADPNSHATANVILRSTLRWSLIIEGILAVVAAVIGFAVAGANGVWSALVGVLMAAVFLGLTAVTMLIGQRVGGGELLSTGYFAIVLGGWFVKVVVFFIVLLTLRGQPWIAPYVFFFCAVAGVLVSLVVDIVVFARARVPYVGEVALPTSNPEADAEPNSSDDHPGS